MNDDTARAHWSFWTVGAVALLWHLTGVLNFLDQQSADAVAAMPESHRAIIDARPPWATAAFAVAVFGGAIGALLLLLRRAAALYLFATSLFAVLAQLVPHLGMVGSVLTGAEIVPMIVMPVLVAAFLVWYARRAEAKGWVR